MQFAHVLQQNTFHISPQYMFDITLYSYSKQNVHSKFVM